MNAAKIDRILDELRDIWRRNPDFRFGQLLVAVAYPDERISFFEEDATFEARIRAQARLLASREAREVDQTSLSFERAEKSVGLDGISGRWAGRPASSR